MVEKFEGKIPDNYKEGSSGLILPKEEKGHVRSPDEVKEARGLIPQDKKIESAEEQRETFKIGTRAKERIEAADRELSQEKKSIETAKIPKEGIKTEVILKEVGIPKPAESFEEVQKGLAEKIKETKDLMGKRFSSDDELSVTRNFYLRELEGYSLKRTGLLLGGVEVTDKSGEVHKFGGFYYNKTEKSVNDFLKGKLQEKFEEKIWTPKEKRGHIRSPQEVGEARKSIPQDRRIEGAAEKAQKAEDWRETFYKMGGTRGKERIEAAKTEDEKLEKGYQNTVKATENARATREEKISFIQKMKTFNREKWGKLVDGMLHLGVLKEKGVLELKAGKKLAVEGGKDLAAIGLKPIDAMEWAGNSLKKEGELWIPKEERGHIRSRDEVQEARDLIPEKRKVQSATEWYETFTKFGGTRGRERINEAGRILKMEQNKHTDNLESAQKDVYKKWGILRFLESRGEKI